MGMAVEDVRRVAVVGSGTVGASWAALFLAHGLDVAVTDPAPDAEERLRRFVERAQRQLAELGCRGAGRLEDHAGVGEALAGGGPRAENPPPGEGGKGRAPGAKQRAVRPGGVRPPHTPALFRSP